MIKKLFLLLLVCSVVSCNPRLYAVSGGMRHHNLSHNKYQPGKHRKPVRVGSSPMSPFWFIFKSH